MYGWGMKNLSYKGTKSKRRPKPSMSEGAGLLSQDSRQREGSRALMGPCAALACAAQPVGKGLLQGHFENN